MHGSFVSFVDSFEKDEDRLHVRFATKVGHFWVFLRREELVENLRRSLQTGRKLEITFDNDTTEITDVKPL